MNASRTGSLQNHRNAMAVFICLLGFFSFNSVVLGATYYVATNGNDAYTTTEAQNINTPWKTIQKAANTMVAGDICQIRGGTYRETATVANSGTSGSPITFEAYGSEVVILDGTESVTGWTTAGGNIWDAPMSWTLGDGNQIFINNVMKPEARWPDAGPLFPWQDSTLAHPTNDELGDWTYINTAGYDSNNTNGWLTDPQLPVRSDSYWNGAAVHILSGYGWIMQHPAVTAYVESTKTLTTDDANGGSYAYEFITGNEYYLTGIKGEMDSVGEWFYNANSTLSMYATASPTGVTVKKRNYGFNISDKQYITFKQLDFFACTVQTNGNTANITYDGLTMQFLGQSSKDASVYGLILRDNDVLRNSDLGWDSRGLVRLKGNSIRIINNNLHDSGYVPTWTAMLGATYFGNGNLNRTLISHNTLQRAGRPMIGYIGRAAIAQYNDLSDGMKLTTDGALFYSNLEVGNTIVRYNLIHDAVGPQGHAGIGVQGLYLDGINSNWIVHHNVIWNLPGFAMQVNVRHNFNKIFNNTCWNAADGALQSSHTLNRESGTHFFNNLFNGLLVGKKWDLVDVRFNLYTDPLFVAPSTGNFQLQATSPAIDQGTPIPGVTDGYIGANPDMGALEYGGTDWTSSVGYNVIPPSPDPTYSMPAMIYPNQVLDGSFESSALAPNWLTANGSNVTMISGNARRDTRLRSGAYTLQFDVGTSEIRQVITGLLPGRRYKVYGGVRKIEAATVAKLGVRNYGYPALEHIADEINRSTPLAPGENIISDITWWTMYNQSFVTGPSSTSAEIYLNVNIPAGGVSVYADDFGVELMQEPDPQSVPMPLFQYTLNQTSGTTAFDSTTNGHDGTINGSLTPTWVAGVRNNALSFDGVDDSVQTLSMDTPTAITVACWAKSAAATWTSWGCFVAKRPSFFFTPVINTQNIRFTVYSSPTTSQTAIWTAPVSFDITAWHHYAAVFSPTDQKMYIYVDGVLSASMSSVITMNPDTGSFFIGQDDYPGRYLYGSMDDVRIYDVALTEREVGDIFNYDSALIFRLKFDETAGSTKAWDASDNGQTGTLLNMNTATAWGAGKISGALTFDGIDDSVQMPSMDTPAALTVACWAKSPLSTWGNFWGCFVSKRPSFFFTPVPDTQDIRFTVYTGPTTYITSVWTASIGFDITQWHHYAAVFSPTKQMMYIYVDGVKVISRAAAITMNPDTGPIFIGQDDTFNNRWFDGSMDDVQIYSRALSWNEILELSLRTNGPPY